MKQIITDTAEAFARREGIELTSYYEYIKSHCVHAFNGVRLADDNLWYSERVVVFLDEDGDISAEVPRSRQKPFGYRTKEAATY